LPCRLISNDSTTVTGKPWEVDTVVKSYDDCFAVKVPAGQKDVSFLPDGTSISTTAKILIDAVNLNTAPTIADWIEHNGTEYQIIAIKPLSPADVDVMWTVYVNV
jgi:hypothetical protein